MDKVPEYPLNGVSVEVSEVDPDKLFRALFYSGRNVGGINRVISQLVVLAQLGETPQSLPRKGDILLRGEPGLQGLGHVAILTNSALWPREKLAPAPFGAERQQPGLAVVSEAGAFPPPSSQPFARRIMDEKGKVPPGQILIRIKILLPPALHCSLLETVS